jgi:hypothetical protein
MVRAIGGKSRILILQVAKARLAAKAKLTLQPTLLQTTKAWGEPEHRPRCRKNKKVKEREPKRREISLSVAGLRFPPSVKIFFDVGLRTSRQKREEASDEGTSCPEKKITPVPIVAPIVAPSRPASLPDVTSWPIRDQ